MNKQNARFLAGFAVAVVLMLANLPVGAAQFQTTRHGEVLAGFRKPNVGNYEVVVNLGIITNFEALPAGTTISMTNFSPAQLLAAFPEGLDNLNWSVSASHDDLTFWAGYPATTLWYTLPRADAGTRTTPPARISINAQAGIKTSMLDVGSGASTISGMLGASNANNTTFLVREPSWSGGDVRYDLSYYIDSGFDGSFGLPNVVENITSASFTAAVRSDLYRSLPTNYQDPDTGSKTGAAYYVGYFQLNPDGTMTFTRASTVVPPPPAPQLVLITRTNTTSTIYFTTTNGATYTLYYTNHFGIGQPVTSWAAAPGAVTGNGNTNSLSDTTTESDRYYRVGAQ